MPGTVFLMVGAGKRLVGGVGGVLHDAVGFAGARAGKCPG